MADKDGKKNGGKYYNGANPKDAEYLREYFVEGSHWHLRLFGGSVGIGTVKKGWIEVPNLSAMKARVIYRDGTEGDVFLTGLEARPVK